MINQDVDKINLGVSLYFKFIKSVLSMLLLILFLNAILFFIYFIGKGFFSAPSHDVTVSDFLVAQDNEEEASFSGENVQAFSLTLK